LRQRPWFLGKAHIITAVNIRDTIALPDTLAHVLVVDVEYGDADTESYLVPLSVATGQKAEALLRERPEAVLARLEGLPDSEAFLFAAAVDRDFSDALLRAIVRRRRFRGNAGELVGSHAPAFRKAWTSVQSNLEPSPQATNQPYTEILFGSDFLLKLYRK